MKLRLMEYLICPEHPDEYLQLRKGHVAKLFDYKGEVRSPLCKSYCGLAQGRFGALPPGFVPDCRFCMSLEVEWGVLQCPVCKRFYSLFEGIPVLTRFFPAGTDMSADRLAAEYHFGKSKLAEYRRGGPFAGWANRQETRFLMEHIDMESVDRVLFLGAAGPGIVELCCAKGVEMVIACEDPHELLRIGEKELLNPSKLYFTMVSGPNPSGIRGKSFDLVISGHRLYGPAEFTPPPPCDLVRLCRKSGSLALLLYHDNFFKRALHLCEGRCGKANDLEVLAGDFLNGLDTEKLNLKIMRYPSTLYELVIIRSKVKATEDIRTPFPGDEAEAMINA